MSLPYIITGASSNHFRSLIQLLNTLITSNKNLKCVVWDLGLTETECIELYVRFSIKLNKFNYNKYPPYFNIHINAGEYAWKPVLINETTNIFGENIYLWLDAGDIVVSELTPLIEFINTMGIYSNPTSKILNHPNVFLEIEPYYKQFENHIHRNGAIIGFNTNLTWVRELIHKWALWAQNKNIIAPSGSNRNNHRQDQTLLTLLYWEAANKYHFNTNEVFRMIHIHQDCD
jgi:hypothetical protein